ncbi:MAG: DolP-mannose mannosyltransferase [Halobacteriales archaeon]|nr:DolP-mannose mannosyltransferase [Halobacteriales archaeon]
MSTASRPLAAVYDADPRWGALRGAAREHWYVWLGLAGLAIQLVTLWRVLEPVGPGAYPPLKDSVIFEYIGWRLAEGGRLYVDVWEVKPPLSFELLGVLAWLAGGDVPLYHTLALAVTNAAVVGAGLVVGLVTYELTADEAASLAAGLAWYALPVVTWRAAYGYKPKYLVVAAGLFAVYLALRDRPLSAGVAGAASVGFWQLAVVFPAIALALVARRGTRRDVGRYLAGVAGLSALMLAPVVYWGAVDELVAEAVLTPLLVTNDGGSIASQIGKTATLFGRTLPVALLGAFGIVAGTARAPRRRWWLAVGAGWFALQVLALDLDAYPDLIPAFGFVALGIGLVLGDRRDGPLALYGLVLAMVALAVATLGPHAAEAPIQLADPGTVSAPYRGAERSTLFWRAIESETCRPFYGMTQHRVVQLTGGSITDVTCGDHRPLWEAFKARYLPGG